MFHNFPVKKEKKKDFHSSKLDSSIYVKCKTRYLSQENEVLTETLFLLCMIFLKRCKNYENKMPNLERGTLALRETLKIFLHFCNDILSHVPK